MVVGEEFAKFLVEFSMDNGGKKVLAVRSICPNARLTACPQNRCLADQPSLSD